MKKPASEAIIKGTVIKIRRKLISGTNINAKNLPKIIKYKENRRGIYLYHIRKTGSTSLNQMFLSLGGKDGRAV